MKLSHDPSHSPDNIDYAIQDRKLLGLTRTCRQIRADLMPICLENTTVLIPYYQVNQYISAFVDSQHGALEDAVGKIVLLRPSVTKTCSIVDFAPLIRLIARAPQFTVSFQDEDANDFDENTFISALLNTHHNPQWDIYAASSLYQINIRSNMDTGFTVEIFVKKEWVEDWMYLNKRERDNYLQLIT